MSMYRQMLLAIVLSTLLALIGALLASTLNARNYLSEQLSAKNTDNATALALVLGQKDADPVMIELTVSALFDRGHYELIRVVNPLGQTVVERTAPTHEYPVPEWFIQLLPLSAEPGQAQISNGWNQLGTLTLISTSRFAYESLWQSVLQLSLALGFSGLVGAYLGTLTLRRLREPLQRVISQADAISERQFVVIDVPDVPELKQLAMAMNSTVTRLKSMFAEEAQRLEVLRITANYDPLTGLANRTFFLVQLLASLDSQEAAGGTLLLVRVANFAKLNRRLGPSVTDDLLKAFAEVLHQREMQNNAVAARIGDADFALLLPSQAESQVVAEALLQALVQASAPFTGDAPSAYIGIGKLQRGQDIASLMAHASSALAAAEAQGVNAIRENDEIDDPQAVSGTDEDTALLITQALDQRRVRLASRPVLDLKGGLIHNECMLELMLSASDEWQPVNRFTQLTELFHLIPRIDSTAIELGLDALRGDTEPTGIALNLSAASLSEESFRTYLLELLGKHPELASRLWLEVPEADVLKQMLVLPGFVAEVRKTGCRTGLTQFGRHFSHTDALHEFGLDFLKVDSSFVRGLQYNLDNQVFLKDLVSAAHKMGMQMYADGVIDRVELAALEVAGFDGAAGPAIGGAQ